MALTAEQMQQIDRFRAALERRMDADDRLGPPMRVDRPDGTTLATRWPAASNLWIEAALRPGIPQMRAGIVTDDRWVSEDLEQTIEDSGDTMSEFVELGFDEVDLHWPAPSVEHYREGGRDFYFATAEELPSLAALDEPATLEKLAQMVSGYYAAFAEAIDRQRAANAE